MRLKRPIQTRFRYGSPTRVNLATHHNSQAHSSKGTRSHHHNTQTGVVNAPTACRHTVSGTLSQPLTGALFTFPSRYSSTIGHQEVFRLTRWSWQIHTGFLEPHATWDPLQQSARFHLPGYHGLRQPIPKPSATPPIYHCPEERRPSPEGPTTPHTQHPPAITRARFSHHPLSLTTTHGITIVFFSYGY